MSTHIIRIGALASLGCAGTFIFGFVLLLTQLMPYIESKGNPAVAVQFVLENHAMLSLWNFVIYIVFGVFLAVLIITLYRRLSPVSSIISQLAVVFGVVWVALVIASGMIANLGLTRVVEMANTQPSLAPSLWLFVFTIKEGIGGSNELVGGLWVTLVSTVMWQDCVYQRLMVLTGLAAGSAGIASTVPLMSELGAVFGILLIVWFVYLSVEMVRDSTVTG